jgi:hypothetical protein
MARGRKPAVEPTWKQMELYELVLKFVAQNGYQPTISVIAAMLAVQTPAARGRIAHLVEKGLFKAAPHKTERCPGFVGLRFLPYQVDDDGRPIERTYRIPDGYTVTFKKEGD